MDVYRTLDELSTTPMRIIRIKSAPNREGEVLQHCQKWLVEKKSLNNTTSESNHGQAAVNNFRSHASEFLGLGHFSHHASIKTNITWCTLSVVLGKVGNLHSSNGKEDLDVSGKSNRANGTKDISVGELVPWNVDSSFLDEHTDNGQHADTSVLEFRPASVFQVNLDIGTGMNKMLMRSRANTRNKSNA
jgi:hypothetical protein